MRKNSKTPSQASWQVLLALLALLSLFVGCSKPHNYAAIDTDANGYLCQKCGAKIYTSRKIFLDSKCPKCKQESLNEVVGFLCDADHHLTIRARAPGLHASSICEQCNAVLKDSLYLPHEKDLKTWGATKYTP